MVSLCNMLCQDFSITASFLDKMIFLSENTSSEMLSYLRCWDYCWKREFDGDVKIENYYQNDGEQLGFYKNVQKGKHTM